MAQETININMSAAQMASAVNANFGELYEGAGGTSHQTTDIKMLLLSKLASTSMPSYEVNLKAGDRIVVDIHPGDNRTASVHISLSELPKHEDEDVIIINNGNVLYGGYGVVHEVEADAKYINLWGVVVNVDIFKIVNVDTPSHNSNRLFGKRWLLIGDSISTESSGIASYGYGEYVSRALMMEKVNIASSGKQTSYFLDTIKDDWAEKYGDFDVITVMMGTNDKAYGATTGSINDSSYQSYIKNGSGSLSYSARLQILFEKLRRIWPQSMIMFISPIKRYLDNGNGGSSYGEDAYQPFVEAMRDVCTFYQIPFINIFDTIDPFILINRKKYFLRKNGYDGTHPNNVGHTLFIAPVVKSGMIEGAQYYEEVYGHFSTDGEASLEVMGLPYGEILPSVIDTMSFEGVETKTIIVHGVNLTGNVSLELTGTHFSIDKTIISDVAAMVWPEVVITYDGVASETATLTLSSDGVEDVVITLNGTVE